MHEHRIDTEQLQRSVHQFAENWTRDAADMRSYLASQVGDTSQREVLGPLLNASGASGVVRVDGHEVAAWGDPEVPEMAFSVTKTVASIVAGLAFDDGLLHPDQQVRTVIDAPEFRGEHSSEITWRHLLQQSSQWEGTLWSKPTAVDKQSNREGTEVHGTQPGRGWAYNDVRVNLLTYALTLLLGRPLPSVLNERVMTPLGASDQWSWHGYRNSTIDVHGRSTEVVSGGAHWGGGLIVSARDLSLLGQLFIDSGYHDGKRLLSTEWIEQSWTPCLVKPEYGYLWWLNDQQVPWPRSPRTGRGARGNKGRHLLWVDPARSLVLASHWTEDPAGLISAVSESVTPRSDHTPVYRSISRPRSASGSGSL